MASVYAEPLSITILISMLVTAGILWAWVLSVYKISKEIFGEDIAKIKKKKKKE